MPSTLYRVVETTLETLTVLGEAVFNGNDYYVVNSISQPYTDVYALCIRQNQVGVSVFDNISDAKNARITELTAVGTQANTDIDTVTAIPEE